MHKLYIDIGGTHLRSELHTDEGVAYEKISSQAVGLLAYIDAKVKADPRIGFIGISYAGQVHHGRIISAPNISIDDASIKERVEARYGIRLEIDNDLNCAVMAEAAYAGAGSIAALYIGTGLGAAVIDEGRLVRGSRNMAFELGHIPYKTAPFACGCGRQNCLELYASGSGIGKWVNYYGSDEMLHFEQLNGSDIAKVRAVEKEFKYALMHAVGTLVTIANPEIIVLGGGIINANPNLLEYIKDQLDIFSLKSSLQSLKIRASELENAALEGAKLLEERVYG